MKLSSTVLLNRLLSRVRFRHLQVIVRLAELGSVKRSAESVGMSQPRVTQLLADMERILGVQLFHRHARGVLPTAACLELLPMFRQSLSGLGVTAEAVADRGQLGQGLIRIWASTAGVNGILLRALPEFNRRYPGVQVHVREVDVSDQFLGIGRGEVDIGILRRPAVVPEGWEFERLMDDEFVVVTSAANPLVHRRRLRWNELAEHRWLASPADSAARRRLDELLTPFGVTTQQCQVITRVTSLSWAMIEGQQLLTLVPASVFRPLLDIGRLVALRLEEPLPFEPLGMILPVRDASIAALSLAAFLRQVSVSKEMTTIRRKSV